MIGIRVENVRKRLGKNQALDGISAEFSPGMIHGVIGPDGAGKTTLFRMLAGLLSPDEGSIVFQENGERARFAGLRSRLSYMPQQQSLYPDLSVSEHLDFFRDLYMLPADLYARRRSGLLEMTRMARFLDRRAGQLSGGMYKKLGLMCSLLQSPSALFLDEPTNGVDPISRREFWELLYGFSKEKILIILSTAYMDEAARCSRVHVMDSGKILASGEPRELLNREGVENFEQLFLKKSQPEATTENTEHTETKI